MQALALYEPGPDQPATPTLDALAARGVRFTMSGLNPLCAPTRATILTRRYGFATGVVIIPPRGASPRNALPLTELTVPAALVPGPGFAGAPRRVWQMAPEQYEQWRRPRPEPGRVQLLRRRTRLQWPPRGCLRLGARRQWPARTVRGGGPGAGVCGHGL